MYKFLIAFSLTITALLCCFASTAANQNLVNNQEFIGKFYPAASNKIAVLVLGGSEGGIPEKLAEPIVAAGFPTLALAYFKEKGLPEELEKIPLEYVETAKNWLRKETKFEKLMIVGWSKGAELALLLAARDSAVSKVIAIAPSSVVWAGILKDWTKVPGSSWTINGKELAHVPFKPSGQINGLLDLYSQSLANRADDGKATIPVEKILAKVILMTGENDEIWPSPQMAKDICQRINSAGNTSCQHLNYSALDHLLNYKFMDVAEPMNKVFVDNLLEE